MSSKVIVDSGLTDRHIQEYFGQGYTVIEDFFDQQELDLMRGISDRAVEEIDRRIDAGDKSVPSINHKGSRYFVPHAHRNYPEIQGVTFGEKMAQVNRRILGENSYLFLDQFDIIL